MRKVSALLALACLALACRGAEPEPDAAAAAPASGAPNLPQVMSPFPKGLSGTLAFESDREGRPKIYTLELETGKITRLTDGPLWRDEHPVWSPDGRRIAFSSTRAGNNFDIYVMDADGTAIERITDHAAPEQDPTWAPDGRSLFFTAERDGRGELYRVWLDSRKVDRVTAGFNRSIMPAASPDGRNLAYAAQTIRAFQIHAVDTGNASEGVQLTSGDPACRPAWSPDGKRIAFVLGEGPSGLGIVDFQSRTVQPFFRDPRLWSYYPAFSPDARWIAFSVSPEHHEGEDWDLAIIPSGDAGGGFQRLTVGPGNDRYPHWKPPAR
jgi:TolB protein